MQSFSRDLRFRTASRHDVALDAKLSLRAPDNERVRYSRTAVSPDGSWPATVVDVSGGGLGVICEVYVPVWARVRVEIQWPGGDRGTLFQGNCMARRVRMIDRRPAYLLGLQYEALTDEQRGALESFMALVDEATA